MKFLKITVFIFAVTSCSSPTDHEKSSCYKEITITNTKTGEKTTRCLDKEYPNPFN